MCNSISIVAEGTFKILSQIKSLEEGYLQKSDIYSITYQLTNLTKNSEVWPVLNLDKNDVFSDVLKTEGWTLDENGYNFEMKSLLPNEGHSYLIKIKFLLINGDIVIVKQNLQAV